MKHFKTALLALALLTAGASASADGVADGNARLQLNFLETSDGTFAFVRVQARYHLLLLGELRIMKNGEVVKVDPVTTSDQVLITTFLGPNGKDYAVCAYFDGDTYLGGDNYLPVYTKTCGFRGPSAPVTPGLRLGSRTPPPRR